MTMHIKPGAYILRHVADGPEVGQVVVVDTPSVVEHWYLYKDIVEGHPRFDNYTTPGSAPGHRDVEILFAHTPSLPGFDANNPLDYKRQLLVQGRGATYIEAKCSDGEDHDHDESEGGPFLPQIDWGRYDIFQGTDRVGEVHVYPLRDGSGKAIVGASEEVWHLYTGGAGFKAYEPPGLGGGAFRINYDFLGSTLAAYDAVTAICMATP